jgi:polygalacturonase
MVACSEAATANATNIFNVRDYGAKGDGQAFDTDAIQKALDACGAAGGGTVKLPAGTYLSKPITLSTKTTFLLEEGATLLASTNQQDFMKTPGDWLQAKGSGEFIPLVGGKNLTDVTITGKGTIDGSGAVWWGEAEKARQRVSGFTLPRPGLVVLTHCFNVRLSGIKLLNSPKFHFVPSDCDGVLVDGVTIIAPEGAANTDGIDPMACYNVKITHCLIDVGDDNIAIKAGRAKVPGHDYVSENIEVTDCTFLHGHGLSIGSEVVGGLRGLTVKNCSFSGTDNGIRIKSRRSLGGVVQDATYTDIRMTNVLTPISIAAYYQDSSQSKFPTNDVAQEMTNGTPIFRNITIKNLTATATKDAGLIIGLPESAVTNVVLDNVHITSTGNGFTIANANGIQLKNSSVVAKNGKPYNLFNAQVDSLP